MPDQDLVPSPKTELAPLTGELSPLDLIALADESLTKRVRRYVEWQTREHIGTELIRSITAAVIIGLIALVSGSATADAAFWTVLGFLAAFVAHVAVSAIHAPFKIDAALRERLIISDKRIKEVTTQARLSGKILCLTDEVHGHESSLKGNYGDCWFTLSVNLWNEGTVGTTVTGFSFYGIWEGTEWPARQVEELHRFRAKSFRPSEPGSSDRYADEIENLFDFPVPTELTTTNSQRGWLRFVIRNFPLGNDLKLKEDTEIRLLVDDKRGDPHLIYQGPVTCIGMCPPIAAIPDPRSMSRLEINFDENRAGFVDHTSVLIDGLLTPCTLYRVSVIYHGSKSTITDLKAEEVTLTNGRVFPPLHLRITGRPDEEKQRNLNPDTPVFWDVVEKVNSDRDWVTLRHTEKEKAILQRTSTTFKITASCDEDLPVTKIVRLGTRDNGDLDFRLFDA